MEFPDKEEVCPCQPRARTRRKPETLTSTRTTTKPVLASIAAVESRPGIDMVRRRSTVRFCYGAPLQEGNSNSKKILGSHSGSQVLPVSGKVSVGPLQDIQHGSEAADWRASEPPAAAGWPSAFGGREAAVLVGRPLTSWPPPALGRRTEVPEGTTPQPGVLLGASVHRKSSRGYFARGAPR